MKNSSENVEEFSLEKWSEFIEKVKEVNHETYVLFISLMGIIFLASLIGNSLTCFIIWYHTSMHTVTNYYLFNLAVSDLILTLAMVLEISDMITDTNSLIMCRLSWFLVTFLWNNGILIITALAIERFLAICYPILSVTTAACRRVAKVIVGVWTTAIAETSLEMLTVGLVKAGQTTVCITIPTPSARLLTGILAIITFIIPLIIITFAYSMIAYQVNNTQMNTHGDQIFNRVDLRSKTNKFVIAITLSFVACWMPFFVGKILICVLDADQLIQLTESWSTWYFVIVISGWLSVAQNPILYSFMSNKFRKALKILWNAIMRRTS